MADLSTLNAPQRQAVLHGAGPLVVFAGAGSGKTRVITYRVANLVDEHGVAPWRILAVTFTNKAAAEMRERCGKLLPSGAQDLWVGTFHATCARLLRRYSEVIGIKRDFVIYDDADSRAMVTRVLRDLRLDEKRYEPKQVLGRIHRAKQEAIGPDKFAVHDSFTEIVHRIYQTYDERMKRSGALDFDDLIFRLVEALEKNESLRAEMDRRFSHVLVDEFQDTNHVQLRLVRVLADRHRNLCVVGDDDQSIYRWRGADRRNILDFRKAFPDATVVKLEQNYRSSARILRAAMSVVTRNVEREPKELWTENAEGAKVAAIRCDDERDEARIMVQHVRTALSEGRRLSDVALFYRIHAQSRVFEEALRAANIPYRVVGGVRFYDRAEVKDVLAYLRLVHNPDDDVSLLRVINVPARGIGKSTIDRVLDDAARAGSSTWDAIRRVIDDPAQPSATRKKLLAFLELVERLRARSSNGEGPAALVQAVLDETSYSRQLEDEDTPEADARLENLRELVGSIQDFVGDAEEPTLASFLELVTLETDADRQTEGDRLTLMTVHAAKGLEFPVVIVAGLEERMFPYRGVDYDDDPEEMEEERRLAYVAFTRAREKLVLTYARQRRVFGQLRWDLRSRFVDEIPPDVLHEIGGAASRPTWIAERGDDSYGDEPGGYLRRPFEAIAVASAAAVSHGESYVDRSDGDIVDEAGLHRGMRVRHSKFGVGLVQGVSGDLPSKITVAFPGWGTKQILARFLEPL